MSQERTEQRDWAKDREIIESATVGPWEARPDYVIRSVNDRMVLRYPIPAAIDFETFRTQKEYDDQMRADVVFAAEARTAWPAALDEIDRLNATIAGLQEAVKEQTAKVQERDAYIVELEKSLDEEATKNGRVQNVLADGNRNLESRIADRDKEIERLRMEMQSSADDLREFFEIPFKDIPFEAKKIADRLETILRGRISVAGIKWENYIIGCSMDGTIRIVKGKIDNKLGLFISDDKSPDLTSNAIHAVRDHMKKHLEIQYKEEDFLTVEFEDGAKLIYEKPPEKE